MTSQQERTQEVLRDLEDAVRELQTVTVRVRTAIENQQVERPKGDERGAEH